MEQPSLTTPPPPAAPAPPAMSLMARWSNLFVAPGEVFEDVKKSPPAAVNWFVPTLLLAVIGVISVWIIFSQPAIAQQVREQQQKALDQQVAAGKLSQAQADRTAEVMEKYSGPAMLKIGGSIGVVFGSFAGVFVSAFLLWLIGRFFLKTKVHFLKMAEVAGLAGIITVLDTIMKTLLILALNNPTASISAAMLVPDPDQHSKVFTLLTLLNPMTFWALAVQSIGLAKFTGASFGRAAAGVFGVWIVLTGFFVGLAMALQSMVGK